MPSCDICDAPADDGQTVTDAIGSLIERAKAAGVDPLRMPPEVAVCRACINTHGTADQAVDAAVDRIIARLKAA